VFWHRRTVGRVELAFTDREDGLSEGPWSSLNLGTSNGDVDDLVRRNLELVAEELDVDRLVRMTQVHGTVVSWTDELAPGEIPVADVLLTDEPGVGVLVRVADCTPIVIVGLDEPVAGVVHCGREGLVRGVVMAAVGSLRERGVEALEAYVGPRACGRCYELPEEMADAVGAVVPEARTTTSWGTPAIDVGAGVMAQLRELGIPATDLGQHECTIQDERLFSYRRQGQDSGRFGAVAVIR
jgi:YfiH family protein